MRIVLFLALAITLAACSKKAAPDPVADDATRRTIAQGEIVGFVTDDGAHSWRAIPFAAPPEGELRWRAPRPAPSWTGLREATTFADRCMQLSNAFDASEGIKPGVVIGSEDCLYLNIFSPPDIGDKKLPVMVWIHGGGNVWGGAAAYDLSRLAIHENVIVVTVQHRLGPLGFFSHDFLREGAQTPEDAAANFATLDLIASLKWVQENIADFGGDPDVVTIFGESAGGANVATLMASPLAADLFHRAIIQSGIFSSAPPALAETGHMNGSTNIVERIGATNSAALRSVDTEILFDAYKTKDDFVFLDMPTVIEDGVSLPAYPMRDAFASLETFNAVPVITGVNRDEMKLFYFGDKRFVGRTLFLFPTPRDSDFYDRLTHYMSRIWRVSSADMPAAAMKAAGHDAVYVYRFDWDDSGKFFFSDFKELLGAAHALEIPFVLNRFEFFGGRLDKTIFQKPTQSERERLSRTMGAYWGAFAHKGEPTAADAPAWAAWPDDGAALMRFDTESDGGVALIDEPDSLERMAIDFRNDSKLDDAERCAIISELKLWQAEFADTLADDYACDASQ